LSSCAQCKPGQFKQVSFCVNAVNGELRAKIVTNFFVWVTWQYDAELRDIMDPTLLKIYYPPSFQLKLSDFKKPQSWDWSLTVTLKKMFNRCVFQKSADFSRNWWSKVF
jgi:hypothetical protein